MEQSSAKPSSSIFVVAPPDRVYRACTDPAALAVWRVPGDMTARIDAFDLQVGGGYRMTLIYPDAAGDSPGKTSAREDRYSARFVELSPPSRIVEAIVFDTDSAAFAGELVMTTTLASHAGGTEVTIAYQGLPSGIRPEDNEAGTRSSLEKLKRYVEGQ